jgi:RNA polymerase sigma-70 factor (ECF subfamily)
MSDHGADSAGDPVFNRFYREHYPEVLAYCRRRVGPLAAEDVSAEVFAAAWRKWSTVPKDSDALPWLYGAARREVLHQWRRTARYRRLMERVRSMGMAAPSGPDHIVVDGVEAELARRAMARLRENDREVLRLAVWEELTHPEIAVVLSLTEDAVGMRFVRAKRRFGEEYRALERRSTKVLAPLAREVADDE